MGVTHGQSWGGSVTPKEKNGGRFDHPLKLVWQTNPKGQTSSFFFFAGWALGGGAQPPPPPFWFFQTFFFFQFFLMVILKATS
jgi:hypothetical protein